MSDEINVEGIFKSAIGLVLTGIAAVVGWLIHSTMKHDKKDELQDAEIKRLKEDLDEFKKGRVTVEQIREMLDEALERRDQKVVERRAEYEHLHAAQLKNMIQEEFERVIPRFLRELRGHSNRRHQPPPGDTPDEGSRVR